jgi:hypothetical protein
MGPDRVLCEIEQGKVINIRILMIVYHNLAHYIDIRK